MAKKKRYYNEGMSGRMAEREGGDMMPMRSMEMANMPQEVMMKMYPQCEYQPYKDNYPDTYSETDAVADKDVNMTKSHYSKSKY